MTVRIASRTGSGRCPPAPRAPPGRRSSAAPHPRVLGGSRRSGSRGTPPRRRPPRRRCHGPGRRRRRTGPSSAVASTRSSIAFVASWNSSREATLGEAGGQEHAQHDRWLSSCSDPYPPAGVGKHQPRSKYRISSQSVTVLLSKMSTLLAGHVHEMPEREVAESLPHHVRALHLRDRLVQRGRHALRVLRLVGVPLEQWGALDLVLDPVQAGGGRRRVPEYGLTSPPGSRDSTRFP